MQWEALASLDPTVHCPTRLAVLARLCVEGPQEFVALRDLLAATDGALGTHLQKLLSAGYIKCQKAFYDGKPRSTYVVSQAGRRALLAHMAVLGQVIERVRPCAIDSSAQRKVG